MGRIALLDGDELAYKVALKYERVDYSIYKDDKLMWKSRNREEAIESILSRDDLELIKERVKLDPNGYEEDIDLLISRCVGRTSSTDFLLCLSGNNNFRYELATLIPYKGTRDDSTKPFHLKLVKDKMVELGGVWIDFLEADDVMSIHQTNYNKTGRESVICSSDKDLRTVPGLNYNIGRDTVTIISEEEANYNFFYQLLVGDPTDNIPSPYGLGDVGANKFLSTLKEVDQKEWYRKLVPFYLNNLLKKDKQGKHKTPWFTGQDVHEVLWEVGNLLWMHRTLDKEERWQGNQ
jgi:hypothetical protein